MKGDDEDQQQEEDNRSTYSNAGGMGKGREKRGKRIRD